MSITVLTVEREQWCDDGVGVGDDHENWVDIGVGSGGGGALVVVVAIIGGR